MGECGIFGPPASGDLAFPDEAFAVSEILGLDLSK